MADPLSITAGVIGITVPALHATRLLLNDLRKISEAPSAVGALCEDVSFVEGTLESLEAVSQQQWTALGVTVTEQSKHAITACTASCTEFRNDLQRWTRHSTEHGFSWRDRFSLGFFRENQIKAMSEQLQKYRTTLTLLISTATLYVSSQRCKKSSNYQFRHSSIRGQQVTAELEAAIADKEKKITDSITSTNQQLAVVNTHLQKLDSTESQSQDTNGTAHEDEAGMRRVIGEEQVMLRVLLALLQGLKLKTQEEAKMAKERKQSTKITFGNNNSGFQLGVNSGSISGFTFGGPSV